MIRWRARGPSRAAWVLVLALAVPADAQEPPPAPPDEAQDQVEEQAPPPAAEEEIPASGDEPRPTQEEAPGAGGEEARPVEEGSRPPHPTVTWPLSSEALAAHLRGIAEAHATIAWLEGIGTSAQGREILVLRLGLRDGAEASRPSLFLADYQGRASAGPEAIVALAWTLASEYERDEGVRALLARANLVLAPALDPDVRSESVAALDVGSAEPTVRPLPASDPRAPGVRFERNFPSGWQPEALRAGSGRVSLSMLETLAAARFLSGLDACALVLGFTPLLPPGDPYGGSDLPEADRAVFRRLGAALELAGARPLVPWFELGSPGGGFFDFAYQARGIYPLLFTLPSEDELARTGVEPFLAEVRQRALACLALLPRVELAQEGIERLAPDTWQLDLRIQNTGILPTRSALARHGGSLADVALELTGAKLVATARRPERGVDYTDPAFQVRAPLSAGTLAGGEERWLRLWLEAGAGAEVSVTASSLWAGRAALRLTLP